MKKVLLSVMKWGSVALFLIQTLLSSKADSFKLVPQFSDGEEEKGEAE